VSPGFTDISFSSPIVPASAEIFVSLFVIYSFRRRCSIGTSVAQTTLVTERQDYIFSFLHILDALGLIFGVPREERRG
jgi:hypothetical protein